MNTKRIYGAVEFNTREKALKCYQALGDRAVDLFTLIYGDKQILGFFVTYFAKI